MFEFCRLRGYMLPRPPDSMNSWPHLHQLSSEKGTLLLAIFNLLYSSTSQQLFEAIKVATRKIETGF